MNKVLIYRSAMLYRSETFIKEQAVHLLGWEPILIGHSIVEDGLDLDELRTLIIDDDFNLVSKLLSTLGVSSGFPGRRNVKALRKVEAKLIHAHFGLEAVRAWPLARALGIPMIVTLHGADINIHKDWWEKGEGGLSKRRYPSLLVKLSHNKHVHFLAVSEAIKRRAVEYGIPADKISVSYIGVDTKTFSPGSEPLPARKNILFVGRLVEKKGCRFLLKAFSAVQDDHPDVTLVVVGSGPLENDLKRYAEKNRIRVNFLGALTPEMVLAQLNDARIFCLPSIEAENGDSEGLPIAILEAQACGIPVITSARGGAEEGIHDGVTGFAHKEKDVGAIVDRLQTLLGDSELLVEMGGAARKRIVGGMDIVSCTRTLEEHYRLVSGIGKDK